MRGELVPVVHASLVCGLLPMALGTQWLELLLAKGLAQAGNMVELKIDILRAADGAGVIVLVKYRRLLVCRQPGALPALLD